MQSKTFRNYLLIILLCMTIPMCIVLGIEYTIISKEIITQAQNNEERLLEECREKYDSNVQNVRLFSAQLIELFGQGYGDEYFLNRNIEEKLSTIQNVDVLQSNGIIRSYYVLFLSENRMIINGSFYDPAHIMDREFLEYPEIKNHEVCNIWKPQKGYYEEFGEREYVETMTLLRSFPVGAQEPQGYIAINVDFNKLVRQFFVSEGREYAIYNENGEGMFLTDSYNKEDYLIFQKKSQVLDWVYEIAVEEKHLLLSLETIKKTLGIIVTLGICGCLGISFLSSRFFYRPINELLHLIKAEKNKNNDNEFELIKSKFIQNEYEKMILEEKTGRFETVYYENAVRSLLQYKKNKEVDIDDMFVNNAVKYQVLVFCDYQTKLQQNGIWGLLKQTMQDEMDISLKFVGTQMQSSVAAVVVYSETDEDIRESVQRFAIEIQRKLRMDKDIYISVGISRPIEDYRLLPEAYSSALDTTYYHIYYGIDVPIMCEDIQGKVNVSNGGDMEKYPSRIEQNILQSLKNRSCVQMLNSVQEFFSVMEEKKLHPHNVRRWINNLKHAIVTLTEGMGIDLKEELNGEEIYADIDVNKYHGLADLKLLIEGYLKAAIDSLSNNTVDKYKELVESVKKYVLEHISEDVSLAAVAEHYKVSVPYLSTIFKQQTRENFVKYLVEVKMSFAAKLLLETQLSIGEISERTGYTNLNSFSNAFKKYYGMAPSQYRYRKIKNDE